jgi:hypothetical protein
VLSKTKKTVGETKKRWRENDHSFGNLMEKPFFSTGFRVQPVPAKCVLVLFQRSEVKVCVPKPPKSRWGTDAPAWHVVCSNR